MKNNLILAGGLFCFLVPMAVLQAETYSSWQAVHFTGAQVAVAAISGTQADPDGDGLSNLLEYAAAGDPWIADTLGATVLGQSQDHLTLSYRRVRTAMDLFTTLQVSGDLTSGWSFPENVPASTDSSNAVYDRITLTDSQTISGVSKRFLRLTVAIDSDQDGLPDDWEMRFFGNLDHLAGDDDDLDTLTNLMEYHRQTDPMDFYNGEFPMLSMNAGNNQTGFAGAELPAALVVKVWHQDGVTAWPNAPVVFATTAGGFFSAGDSPVVVRADGNGAVGLSYTLPNTSGPLTITATAGKAPNQRSVTFAETVSALPMSLGPITAEGTGTSIILTWTPAPAASSYTAQHFNPITHTWETVATASAGSSTLTDAGTNLAPGVIALYKILGNDGSSLHSESAVEGGIINPEDNNDTDTLTNGEEVAAGSYAKERAANELQTGNLAFGGNPAGWMGPDPKLPDTDADGVADDLDGWANDPDYSPPRLPDTHYAVIDLNQWGVAPGDYIAFFNDNLQLAGYTGNDFFRWENGQKTLLTTPEVDTSVGYCYLESMNNAGTIIGNAGNPAPRFSGIEAVVWAAGSSGGTFLAPAAPPLPSGTTTEDTAYRATFVSGFNDGGQIVGQTVGNLKRDRAEGGHTVTDYGTYHVSALWTGGQPTLLGGAVLLPAGTQPSEFPAPTEREFVPVEINNLGWILGDYEDAILSGTYRSSIRDPATGNKTALANGFSYAMDDASPPHIVGNKSNTGVTSDAATLWERTAQASWQAKEVFRGGLGQINNRGEIVANYLGVTQYSQTLVRNLKPVDFDPLLPPGWANLEVERINNHGIIVGTAFKADSGVSGTTGTTGTYPHVMGIPVEIGVDANRDGQIKFGQDTTTSEKPFRFWLNDDDDRNDEDHPGSGTKDNANSLIESQRDLEDFTRLHINIGGLQDQIVAGNIQVGMEWRGVSTGTTPALKIYTAAELDGGDQYLKTSLGALNQSTGLTATALGTITNGGSFRFPSAFWQADFASGRTALSTTNPNRYLLFEGSGEGKGCLVLTFWKGTQKIGEGGSLWIDLKNIKKMYQRKDVTGQWPTVTFESDPTETKQAVVFVHGWRMSPDAASSYAESMYKRMWHRGFKGRFAAFRWNTDYSDNYGWVPIEQVGQGIDSYLAQYNDSEHNAWLSGQSLKNFVESMPSGYSKNLIAHSMGNIVAGSAFSSGLSVDQYAMLQAAVPASCYDESASLKETTQYTRAILGFLPITMWDEASPDDDPDPATRDVAYRGRLKAISANVTSFYMIDDYATSFAWEVNNDLTKPLGAILAGPFTYERTAASGKKLYKYRINLDGTPQLDPITYLPVVDHYLHDAQEAMPYADRSWSKAVGANGDTANAVDDKVQLNTPTFGGTKGFDKEHSAEFDWRIQQLKPFYDTLLDKLRLPRNP